MSVYFGLHRKKHDYIDYNMAVVLLTFERLNNKKKQASYHLTNDNVHADKLLYHHA